MARRFSSVSCRSSTRGDSVSWSGVMFSTSRRSGGFLPYASSTGENPLLVSWTLRAQQQTLATCLKDAFLVNVSSLMVPDRTLNVRLNNLTADSARFGHGVLGPRGTGLIPWCV